jgi:hypothetical protein
LGALAAALPKLAQVAVTPDAAVLPIAPIAWVRRGIDIPSFVGKRQRVVTQWAPLGPEPGQQIRREITNSYESFNTGHPVDLSQFEFDQGTFFGWDAPHPVVDLEQLTGLLYFLDKN